eukprot:TRINITY_DN16030_c0_g1_i1.p1 TRINITY_DN16030_c0_g1~~TRINITY_DN16030_c0_g1_i1.p1  ORF type:complete len:201 (-),score=38.97 TRINITY_DN16030_c0_g1_i1:53-604(-)
MDVAPSYYEFLQAHDHSMPALPTVRPGDDGNFTCWICLESADRNQLIRPCGCAEYVHRSCLDQWRFSGINPQSYTRCPNCHFVFKLVTASNDSMFSEAARQLRLSMWKHILRFWGTLLLLLLVSTVALGLLTYAADPNKNVPVMVKFSLVSLTSGVQNVANTTAAEYREDVFLCLLFIYLFIY